MTNTDSQQLVGILFGASKAEAHDAWNNTGLLIDKVKAAIVNFPKASAALGSWGKLVPLEAQFYKDRQYVYDSSRGITDWDKYIRNAAVYSDSFMGLIGEIAAQARTIGEKSLSADYNPPDPNDKGDNTGLYVGVGVGIVVAIALAVYLNRRS